MRAYVPMPLLRRRDPFDDPAWFYELKLDGFRALAHVDRGRCRLISRNGHTFRSWQALSGAVATQLRAGSAVLDGEIACLDDDGRSDFHALMLRRAEPYFVAFDLLMLDGEDLRAAPLVQRKQALRRVVPRGAERLRFLGHVVGRGVELFRTVCERDLEGIVAKRRDGIYDAKATTWLKVKNASYSQARDRHELFEPRRRRA